MADLAAVYTQRIPGFISLLLPIRETGHERVPLAVRRRLSAKNNAGGGTLFELFHGEFYDFDGLVTGFHCFSFH